MKKKGQPPLKDFRWAMWIPNMCLALKLDNGKVVSIANEQTDRQNHKQNRRITEPSSTVLVYRSKSTLIFTFYNPF